MPNPSLVVFVVHSRRVCVRLACTPSPAVRRLMVPVCLSPGTPCQINKVLSHPTLPITITAQEDRHIKFFDNNSGKLIHSMVAHLDAVTSLAVDPNGLYLMSGSKYLFTTMSSSMVCLSSHLNWQRQTLRTPADIFQILKCFMFFVTLRPFCFF